MQQSSSSIGNQAAALAKAQAELVNPEKSMIATIPGVGKRGDRADLSLTRRSPAASTLYARPWANMRAPPCGQPRSTM